MLLGHKALHSVAVMSKLKRALLYEMSIALVLLQWEASLLGPAVQVKANKQ